MPGPRAGLSASVPVPANFAQLAATVILALALSMLLFALWDGRVPAVAQWTAREWRVLPCVSIYLVTAVMALCIQSAIPNERLVLYAGLLALSTSVALLSLRPEPAPRTPTFERRSIKGEPAPPEKAEVAEKVRGIRAAPTTVFNFIGFAAALFSAVLLGTWLGRGMRQPLHFLMLVLCAVSGNAWMATVGLGHDPAASYASSGVLSLLSIPWPSGAPANFCPTVLELLVLCTVLEGARVLKLHRFSMFLGAGAGYCGGAFLALDPWPAWPVPGVLMCASGILIASWPDLRITRRDVLKSILASLSLLVVLLALTVLRQRLVPEPEPVQDVFRYKGST